MLIYRISICKLLKLLFFISLLTNLRSCEGQGTSFKDNCSNYGLTCIVFHNCPNANAIIQSGSAIPCGFETIANNPTVKICCNLATKVNTTTARTSSSTTARTTTSSTTSRTTLPRVQPNTPVVRLSEKQSSRNATAIALEKCQEYAKLKTVLKFKSGQIGGEVGTWYNKTDCVNVVQLIVGGAPALPKEYPHMALIGYGNKFSQVQWGCGGSLISERFIMSAAHCGQTSSLGPPRWALLGDLTLSSKKDDALPATYSIIKVIDHPNYVKPAHYNDISLFELNTTVKMSVYVRPACLHTSMTDLPAGTKASITGWGKTDTIARNLINDKLLKASVGIIDEQACAKTYSTLGSSRLPRGFDKNSMLCAGDLLTGNDTCQGDSGGPIQTIQSVCMWNIIGITSFGPAVCGNEEDPAVYTRVANYLNWIQSIVWP